MMNDTSLLKKKRILFLRVKGQFAVNLRNEHILDYLRARYIVEEYQIAQEELLNIAPPSLFRMFNFAVLISIMRKSFIDSKSSVYAEYKVNQFTKHVNKVIRNKSRIVSSIVTDFDCMHATDIFSGYIAYKVNRITGIPYVIDLHDIYHEVFRAYNAHPRKIKLYDRMEREIVNSAQHVICVSDLSRMRLHHLYNVPLREISVIPNGTEELGLCASFDKQFKVVFSGNFNNIEKVIDFIKAKELLTDNTVEFYLMGDGDERESYLNYINRNHLDISYLGLKKWHHAMVVLSKMQAGVAPAMDHTGRKACSPMKVMDYAICGLPVVVSDYYSISDTIRKYNAGIVIEGSSPQGIKKAIIQLLDKDTWNEKSKNSKKLALREFLWSKVLEPINSIYV